ncbi:MAG TPA: (d)CMP kinase [Ornithinimicrobium sp.]|uniref:(d)CMP kinase n=1 Tax=Ornithinimicrobium sp. TaxID=1977084 RepID=UPI002B463414|nr:(d)CMP kinase [Ornithinimicrobium sp.]HKJ11760.1 (d)CMP kinase [Ornithinimicrobium sp.]
MPPRPVTIAIDGPSGSGKSSVSRAVAGRLGLRYLDTGAMFRAVTWWCLSRGMDLGDRDLVAEAADSIRLRMGTDPQDPSVEVDGERVDRPLRTAQISAQVSQVATNPQVRRILAAQQRRIIDQARGDGGIVVEGRDITTVIAPDAEHRVLLSASEEARLRRRAAELQAGGETQKAAQLRDQVLRRDRDDSTVSSFQAPAPGVHGIDTSSLTFEESVAAVIAVVETPGETAETRPHTEDPDEPAP